MTVVRPLVAFLTAFVAGITENMINPPKRFRGNNSTLNCTVDNCCDGEDCLPEEHSNHHGFLERAVAGMRYAFGELWEDLVGWFLVGLVLAGVIAALVPEELLGAALGGGFGAMILMLVIGVPLYICATASTPIAAALILKGVSPGAALVFLLVGPATNIASMSVLVGLLGKRATAVYLAAIASVSVAAGLVLDLIYRNIGIDAGAVMGQAGEIVPGWLQILGAAILIGVSIRPLAGIIGRWWRKLHSLRARAPVAESCCSDGCG
jgi:uncharacterized membrane protein YraQ (UPF0718 family)